MMDLEFETKMGNEDMRGKWDQWLVSPVGVKVLLELGCQREQYEKIGSGDW